MLGWRRKKLGSQDEKVLLPWNPQEMYFIVHRFIGNVFLSINCLLIGLIVATQKSKHFLMFLFTSIDVISIPMDCNFSATSLVTTLLLQSAWQSAVISSFSTKSSPLSLSKVLSAQISSRRSSFLFLETSS